MDRKGYLAAALAVSLSGAVYGQGPAIVDAVPHKTISDDRLSEIKGMAFGWERIEGSVFNDWFGQSYDPWTSASNNIIRLYPADWGSPRYDAGSPSFQGTPFLPLAPQSWPLFY